MDRASRPREVCVSPSRNALSDGRGPSYRLHQTSARARYTLKWGGGTDLSAPGPPVDVARGRAGSRGRHPRARPGCGCRRRSSVERADVALDGVDAQVGAVGDLLRCSAPDRSAPAPPPPAVTVRGRHPASGRQAPSGSRRSSTEPRARRRGPARAGRPAPRPTRPWRCSRRRRPPATPSTRSRLHVPAEDDHLRSAAPSDGRDVERRALGLTEGVVEHDVDLGLAPACRCRARPPRTRSA